MVCFSTSFLIDVKQPSILNAFSKPKPSSQTTSRKVPSFDSSDSEGEVKAPVTKGKPILKRKQADSDDSDSGSDSLMSRIKAKTTASSKVSFHTELRFQQLFNELIDHEA